MQAYAIIFVIFLYFCILKKWSKRKYGGRRNVCFLEETHKKYIYYVYIV